MYICTYVSQGLSWFESFYRPGSIIYGGGQVVLPILLNECVQYESVSAVVMSYIHGQYCLLIHVCMYGMYVLDVCNTSR